MKLSLGAVLVIGVATWCCVSGDGWTTKPAPDPYCAYLMAYFGPEEKLFYAYSFDARNWKALNGRKPVFDAEVRLRDPFINRAKGKFHLVHTKGWDHPTIFHWESSDLINWEGGAIDVVDRSRTRAWAPEFYYSEDEDLFYLFWASIHDGHNAIHYLTTDDWKGITPENSALYYDIGIDDIDLTIVEHEGLFYGFHKPGGVADVMGNRLSTVTSLDPSRDSFARDGHGTIVFDGELKPTEGPEVIKLIGQEKWYVYGDPFEHPMQAWETSDFVSYKKIAVSTPEGSKHCSMIPITQKELERLLEEFPADDEDADLMGRSIRDFGVLPENDPAQNAENLQRAIDWAAPRGAALFVEPSDEPYPVAGGIVLKRNASLIGVHGPVGRGTRHRDTQQPVGSVFAIEDETRPFVTVEGAVQISGIQFWYRKQTADDGSKIIAYPPTIRVSQETPAQGVTLRCLTFFGEYLAMDFNARREKPCEQILIEHCYGYPLSGTFIRIDHCYDIPRILHCHVNPANRRFIDGGHRRDVIDAVMAKKSFCYVIDHTDNAQLIDVFTFGTWGGVFLGPASYGQLTNFNLDCVCVGIHKMGDSDFNRNWQISQGSVIANAGGPLEEIHPFIVEGKGHTSITNVECFSGGNGALTTVGRSQDFLLLRGEHRLSVSIVGCRMANYAADDPITVQNPKALVQASACVDKAGQAYNTLKN